MHTGRRAAASAVALAVTGLAGCGSWFRPSPIKMDLLFDDRACTRQAPVLLVLLPGANMTPAEMIQAGMVAAVRERQIAVDVVLADAQLNYIYDGSMLQRLRQDVIAPLRARGYRRIWLAGISLGGFVAIGYAMRHPGEVEGLVTLAPYLGRRPLVQAVSEATSPAAWRQSAQPREADDFDHELWMWLTRRPADTPPLYMGYGTEDRFAQGHQTLAGLLPAGHADTVAGGHDWAPWQQLWGRWLDRGLLPHRCSA